MKLFISKKAIYNYYVDDVYSELDDVYELFDNYFNNREWVLHGSKKEVKEELRKIMAKYPMDLIVNRFINSGLAFIVKN